MLLVQARGGGGHGAIVGLASTSIFGISVEEASFIRRGFCTHLPAGGQADVSKIGRMLRHAELKYCEACKILFRAPVDNATQYIFDPIRRSRLFL